ncbi:MAG: hypothetical protein HYS13_08215, partial [Planctomycetia bacterium]|nr:hypothetical protein [Planctomycetia bacterium]
MLRTTALFSLLLLGLSTGICLADEYDLQVPTPLGQSAVRHEVARPVSPAPARVTTYYSPTETTTRVYSPAVASPTVVYDPVVTYST